jgi:hypothetical protein
VSEQTVNAAKARFAVAKAEYDAARAALDKVVADTRVEIDRACTAVAEVGREYGIDGFGPGQSAVNPDGIVGLGTAVSVKPT